MNLELMNLELRNDHTAATHHADRRATGAARQRITRLLLIPVLALIGTSGCSFLTGAAAGATGGYVASEEGVEVRNPIEVDESEDDDD